MSTFVSRLKQIDPSSNEAAILLSSLIAILAGIAAVAVPAPLKTHNLFLMLAVGQATVAFISALRLTGVLRAKPADDVESYSITH